VESNVESSSVVMQSGENERKIEQTEAFVVSDAGNNEYAGGASF